MSSTSFTLHSLASFLATFGDVMIWYILAIVFGIVMFLRRAHKLDSGFDHIDIPLAAPAPNRKARRALEAITRRRR